MTDTTATTEILQMPQPEKRPGRYKMPSTIAFAVGIVLFFLPFIEIRCNGMSLKKVNGAELATGFDVNGPGSNNSFFDGLGKGMERNNVSVSNSNKKDPNVYALAALVLGALGLLLSILNLKAGGIGGVLTGGLAAVAMIGLWVDIRRQLKTDMSMKDLQTSVSISVEFTPWFYIAILAFIAAAYFSYKRMKT